MSDEKRVRAEKARLARIARDERKARLAAEIRERQMKRFLRRKEIIGHIGVDTAQLLIGDPCYIVDKPMGRMDWDKFCDEIIPLPEPPAEMPTHWTIPFERHPTSGVLQAAVIKTGYGDGAYPIEIEVNDEGRVMRVSIVFIDDEDEE